MDENERKAQRWLTRNFSLQYPYTIQQTGDENIHTYHLEIASLI